MDILILKIHRFGLWLEEEFWCTEDLKIRKPYIGQKFERKHDKMLISAGIHVWRLLEIRR